MAKEKVKEKKEKKEVKVKIERTYIVPLRKPILLAQRHKRAKKAVSALKRFLEKHMKSENVKIGKYANLFLWKKGMKNPPTKIKVVAKKFDDDSVMAELFGAPVEKIPEPKKAGKTAKKEDKGKEAKPDDKKIEDKVEKPKETKQEKAKVIEKEELKELQKEKPKTHHPPKEPKKPKQIRQEPTAPKQQ